MSFFRSCSSRTERWDKPQIRMSGRSADFQSAVSAGFQPAGLHPMRMGLGTSHAGPSGNRRYSRLEICATCRCRPCHGLLCNISITDPPEAFCLRQLRCPGYRPRLWRCGPQIANRPANFYHRRVRALGSVQAASHCATGWTSPSDPF